MLPLSPFAGQFLGKDPQQVVAHKPDGKDYSKSDQWYIQAMSGYTSYKIYKLYTSHIN